MVRKAKAAPEGDDNLTGNEEEALFIHHLDKLRQQAALVTKAKSALDAVREQQTVLFRTAKADGFSRKELQAILTDGASSRRDLEREEERRAKLRVWAGLPAGAQGELFERLPEEVKDEQYYEGEGYAAGLRGDTGDVPDHVSPRFVQAWSRGWGAGQEKLAWGLAAAGRIVDRKPDASANPVHLDPEPEEDEQAKVDAEAKRLVKAGFTERSEAEDLVDA